ncbi:multicopper oxidase family protein [Tumebacillus lipolyticus]|uniref:Multicopper oxidase family protein n=1 Tax=Tumebacillus lipolyticus TaxID=1280370 RepID=A0ABW5A1B7_9BACL
MRKTILISALCGGAIIAASFVGYRLIEQKTTEVMQGVEKQDERGAYREFVLKAQAESWQLKAGVEKITAWTFGGTVPGAELRIQEGQRVKVVLQNSLAQPVSIHWHGYPVPNEMDGIPGVTQNAVQPGASFTYEFTASVPGTYWYHSHQDSANQVDRGLYGALIVEPKAESTTYDRDYTLILDEWSPEMLAAGGESGASGGGMDHSQHGANSKADQGEGKQGGSSTGANADHSQHGANSNAGQGDGKQGESSAGANADHSQHGGSESAPAVDHDAMMQQMYNIYTVNGKAGDQIKPLQVKTGEKVKLRLINAGYQTHQINLANQPFRITHVDGQPLLGSPEVSDQLLAIAPGERYDLELISKGDNFPILCANRSTASQDMTVHVEVDGKKDRAYSLPPGELPLLDITKYGQAKPIDQNVAYDVERKLTLDNKVIEKDGAQETVYTIDGQVYPDIAPLQVQKGQQVKLTMTNVGTVDHPMHLHGHFFQVLRKDGKPLQGSPLLKDTLNVRPGETYEVAFVANNDGNWMFHCHELHHAAAGMMTTVQYRGYRPHFTPDPNAGNISE